MRFLPLKFLSVIFLLNSGFALAFEFPKPKLPGLPGSGNSGFPVPPKPFSGNNQNQPSNNPSGSQSPNEAICKLLKADIERDEKLLNTLDAFSKRMLEQKIARKKAQLAQCNQGNPASAPSEGISQTNTPVKTEGIISGVKPNFLPNQNEQQVPENFQFTLNQLKFALRKMNQEEGRAAVKEYIGQLKSGNAIASQPVQQEGQIQDDKVQISPKGEGFGLKGKLHSKLQARGQNFAEIQDAPQAQARVRAFGEIKEVAQNQAIIGSRKPASIGQVKGLGRGAALGGSFASGGNTRQEIYNLYHKLNKMDSVQLANVLNKF